MPLDMDIIKSCALYIAVDPAHRKFLSITVGGYEHQNISM